MKGNAMNRLHRIESRAGNTTGAASCANAVGVATPVRGGFHGAARAEVVRLPLIALVVFASALAAVCLIASPMRAFADNQQLDAPVTVSDDITRLNVSKLNADTHEFVQGATMAIIDEETGEIVDQWVTGSSAHETNKTLDVGTVYILREISAPEGFEKVKDVRFQVKETEGSGVTVLSSGDDSELVESYKFALYDKPISSENEVTVTKTTTSTTVAPKTGDETPLSLVAGLMGLGVSAILILQLFKRRIKE